MLSRKMLPIFFLAKCNFGDWRAVLFINRNHAFLISSHSNWQALITAPSSSPLRHQSALGKWNADVAPCFGRNWPTLGFSLEKQGCSLPERSHFPGNSRFWCQEFCRASTFCLSAFRRQGASLKTLASPQCFRSGLWSKRLWVYRAGV